MYDYKIIRIPISMWTGKPKEDYLNVIREYAEEGWRFIQIYRPPSHAYGNSYYQEVIFEKQRKEG